MSGIFLSERLTRNLWSKYRQQYIDVFKRCTDILITKYLSY